MKKQITKLSTLVLALCSFAALSQERVQPCNTYAAMEQAFANPELRQKYEAAQAQLRADQERNVSARPSAQVYTVPVVFHVIYECNGINISDATIIQSLAEINNDYARNSSDTNLVVQPFKSSYINSDIVFMLAKKDPQGNCTNGIVRHLDPVRTHWSQTIANNGNNSISNPYWAYTWDPNKYLNVYLVSEIVAQGAVAGGGIIVGYTFRPGPYASNPHDAIVYNMTFLGGTGNGGVNKSRSLSHEMGHWLNLAHTFGNTNNPGTTCSDDGITDTPITKGELGGCASSTIATCTQTNPAMNGLNNVQNIMNYSDCPRNFTTGQTNAMRTCLQSTVNGRNGLYSNTNLAFTGVNNTAACAPVADFASTTCGYTVCAGGSITFKDMSFNAPVTSYAWAADNGATIANPSSSLTAISFPNIGNSNVTMTVTNGAGTDIVTKIITVMDNTPGFGPVQMESFENPGVPTNWQVIDLDADGVTWQQANNAAYDGGNSFMIQGISDQAGRSDILQMPIMDLLNYPNNVFEFAYAYRQSSPTQNDILKIEGSKDCGGSWSTIYSMNANTMQNGSGGIGTTDFVPASNEWKTYTLSAHPLWQNFKSSPNVMLRFNFIEGGSGNGNNIYLDAVNWYTGAGTTVGINELTKSISLSMYPNPTNGETDLKFNLHDAASVSVSVMDVTGREVLPSITAHYNAGEQIISINKDNALSKGVYFVNVSLNGAKMSRKLVIN